MALEIGTNTYADADHADRYIEIMGLPLLSDQEPLLKRATRILDDIYGTRFIGTKSSDTQMLEWPRDGASSIPPNIADATVELALLIDSGINPFAPPGPSISSESFSVGPISESKTYAQPYTGFDTFHRIEMLLARFVKSQLNNVRLVRG